MIRCTVCNKTIDPEKKHGWQVLKKDHGSWKEYDYYCYSCGVALRNVEPLDWEYLEMGCNISIVKEG